MKLGCGNRQLLGPRARPGEADLVVAGLAHHCLAVSAAAATTTRAEALADHLLPDQSSVDVVAHGGDPTGPLVARHDRVSNDVRRSAPSEHLDVGAADPGVG